MAMRFLFFFSIILYSFGVWGQSINDSLRGYWLFDGNADDASGYGNHGVVSGATLTSDRFGNPDCAYLFDGNLDVITVPHSNSVNITGDITIGCWVKLDQKSSPYLGRILIKNQATGYIVYGLFHGVTNYLYGQLEEANQASVVYIQTADNVVQNATWEHIAMTREDDTLKIYVNAQLIEILNISGFTTIDTVISDLTIGNAGINASSITGIQGAIDDVRLYSRALSDCEISELFTGNPCSLGIYSNVQSGRKRVCIVDMLGRVTEDYPNTLLIFIYDDGTAERVYRIE